MEEKLRRNLIRYSANKKKTTRENLYISPYAWFSIWEYVWFGTKMEKFRRNRASEIALRLL